MCFGCLRVLLAVLLLHIRLSSPIISRHTIKRWVALCSTDLSSPPLSSTDVVNAIAAIYSIGEVNFMRFHHIFSIRAISQRLLWQHSRHSKPNRIESLHRVHRQMEHSLDGMKNPNENTHSTSGCMNCLKLKRKF